MSETMIVNVNSMKGGVGKTTIALAIANRSDLPFASPPERLCREPPQPGRAPAVPVTRPQRASAQ